MADEICDIRSRIDIVELVGQTVSLRKAGRSFMGLCPFHQERRPSFSVNPVIGRYTCWSCGEKGDIFDWVMKTRNVEFAEALQILAKQAGVALKSQDPAKKSIRLNQEAIMEASLTFFRDELEKSSEAQAYCKSRGLDAATMAKWELGFAPCNREALTNFLKKKGFRLSDCKTLSVCDGSDANGFHDKFFNRLMFPIRDERGDLVGYGGRALGDGHPKYINSSETPLFKKGRLLYGMHHAREHMREKGQAVLVEGNVDVIACHQAGVENAVATLGTALSEEHAKLIKRWCSAVVIMFDSDEAGRKAANRSAETLQTEGLKVKVALIPEGKDPDTLLRDAGSDALKQVVEGSLSPLAYRVQSLRKLYEPDAEDFWREAVVALAAAESELEKAEYIDRLASIYPKTRDKPSAKRALTSMVERASSRAPATPNARPGPGKAAIVGLMASSEVTVFRALLEDDYRDQIWTAMRQEDLWITATAAKLADRILASFPDRPPQDAPSIWVNELASQAAKDILLEIELDSRMRLTPAFVTDAVSNLQKKRGERELDQLKEKEGDRLAEIDRKLRELKTQ